jgi:outer membrane receptor protein involved in Fe transport
VGEAEVNGAEVRAEFFPLRNVMTFANYTYQDGNQTDTRTGESFYIPNLPKMKANAGITFRLSEVLTISTIVNWVGDRRLPRSNPYGAARDYKMAGYALGNVVLSTRKFFRERISASVNILNVLNTKYIEPGVRAADGQIYSTVLEQPGRFMLFKLSVDLGNL